MSLLGPSGDTAWRNLTHPKNGAPVTTEQSTAPTAPAPWSVNFRDGMWEVTCSDGSLGGRFPREGDARTFADVAGPGPMTIVSTGRLDGLVAEVEQLRVRMNALRGAVHVVLGFPRDIGFIKDDEVLIEMLRAEDERLRTAAAASRLRADTHQERADQLAVDLMAFADNMHTMAGQYPDNAAARNAFQVAEQRVRDMLTSDRARENGS